MTSDFEATTRLGQRRARELYRLCGEAVTTRWLGLVATDLERVGELPPIERCLTPEERHERCALLAYALGRITPPTWESAVDRLRACAIEQSALLARMN
jgi:hypothetical protein